MQLIRYLSLIWTFAFRRFAGRTDGMQVVAASLLPLLAPFVGIENPAEASSRVLAYIGMTALALIALRLICAPYFIWKSDQVHITSMESDLRRPERKEEEAGLEHRIALRRELGERLASMVAVAEFAAAGTIDDLYRDRLSDLTTIQIRIREIISLLSYDVALRVTCVNLNELCGKIPKAVSKREDTHSLLTRLWSQRKLTFRLIHRDDEVNDLMTMIEIENLIEPWGEGFHEGLTGEEGEVFTQLRDMAKQLGPDVRLMGKWPNLTSPASWQAQKGGRSGGRTGQ